MYHLPAAHTGNVSLLELLCQYVEDNSDSLRANPKINWSSIEDANVQTDPLLPILLNQKNAKGQTPLMLAASHKQPQAVELLLKKASEQNPWMMYASKWFSLLECWCHEVPRPSAWVHCHDILVVQGWGRAGGGGR